MSDSPSSLPLPNRTYIRKLVGKFGDQFPRKQQRQAYAEYLYQLIAPPASGHRAIAAGAKNPSVLRHFIRSSPWSADAVMDRLRHLVAVSTDETGVLVLLQVALPKQGLGSQGAEPRVRRDNASFSTVAQRAYHQRVISAWWVVGGRAWLVSARLHCPRSWVDRIALRPTRKSAAPLEEFQGEADRAASALKVLKPLIGDKRWGKCPIILDGDFDNEWEIVRELSRCSRNFLVNIRDDHGWPLNSESFSTRYPLHGSDEEQLPECISRLPRKGVPRNKDQRSLEERWNVFERGLAKNAALAELVNRQKLNPFTTHLNGAPEMFYTNMAQADAGEIAQSLIIARTKRNDVAQSKLGRGYPLLWQGFQRHAALCAISLLIE